MEKITYHEAASVFPKMDEVALGELAEDIAANGLRDPILLVDGQILDGRNRYEACKIAGVEPRFKEYQGDKSNDALLRCSFSLNMKRRHLDASQKAMIAITILPMLEKEARQRQKDAGRDTIKKRAAALHDEKNPKAEVDSLSEDNLGNESFSVEEGLHTEVMLIPNVESKQSSEKAKIRRAADEVGAIVGVSGRYVQVAKRIEAQDKELAAKVLAKELTISEAQKILADRLKNKEEYKSAPKEASLELTIPVGAHMQRSELLDLLRQSEADHPEDIEIFTKAGGKKASLNIVQKVKKGS